MTHEEILKVNKMGNQQYHRLIELDDEVLNYLFSKYNLSNIVRRYEGSRYPYYFLPHELITDSTWSTHYAREISSDGLWICSNKISMALKYLTNITTQIYYDLLVLHIKYIEERPRCEFCGDYLEFQGRVSRGYNKYSNEQSHKFCSTQCSTLYYWRYSDEDSEFLLKGNI